jgi:hypothetical protein
MSHLFPLNLKIMLLLQTQTILLSFCCNICHTPPPPLSLSLTHAHTHTRARTHTHTHTHTHTPPLEHCWVNYLHSLCWPTFSFLFNITYSYIGDLSGIVLIQLWFCLPAIVRIVRNQLLRQNCPYFQPQDGNRHVLQIRIHKNQHGILYHNPAPYSCSYMNDCSSSPFLQIMSCPIILYLMFFHMPHVF